MLCQGLLHRDSSQTINRRSAHSRGYDESGVKVVVGFCFSQGRMAAAGVVLTPTGAGLLARGMGMCRNKQRGRLSWVRALTLQFGRDVYEMLTGGPRSVPTTRGVDFKHCRASCAFPVPFGISGGAASRVWLRASQGS